MSLSSAETSGIQFLPSFIHPSAERQILLLLLLWWRLLRCSLLWWWCTIVVLVRCAAAAAAVQLDTTVDTRTTKGILLPQGIANVVHALCVCVCSMYRVWFV